MTNELATELQITIERGSDELRRSSPLLRLARQGKLPPRALALYLESLRYLFRSSQANLALAAEVARREGHGELAAYFAGKAREERGHDAWASDDLSRLPPSAAQDIRPARAIVELVQLQGELIEQHPLCFAAYSLWAEYFTVLLGDEWLEALSASGYARADVSAIARHVDADREHAAHGFGELERLWRGEPPMAAMVEAVQRAARVFAAFCNEVYDAAEAA